MSNSKYSFSDSPSDKKRKKKKKRRKKTLYSEAHCPYRHSRYFALYHRSRRLQLLFDQIKL